MLFRSNGWGWHGRCVQAIGMAILRGMISSLTGNSHSNHKATRHGNRTSLVAGAAVVCSRLFCRVEILFGRVAACWSALDLACSRRSRRLRLPRTADRGKPLLAAFPASALSGCRALE